MRIGVRKLKWQAGIAAEWDAEVLGSDRFGTWLFCREGELHHKPDGTSPAIPSDGVQLLPHTGWWAAWWWRNDHWIGVDICTPPTLDAAGWSYTDLELDLVRRKDGTVLLVDEDEFERAAFPPTVAAAARRTASELQARLADATEPVVAAGWQWLAH